MPATKNPFPGMNPYLQQHWSDVHTRLITFISEALSGELPDDLAARAEERITVATEDDTDAYRADVALVEPWKDGFPPVWTPPGGGANVMNVAEPIVFIGESFTERWIEIRDGRGTLITVIEILSPANKLGHGWGDYRSKQRDFILGGIHLVEIDLIRGGNHVTAIGSEQLKFPPGTCHHVCVARKVSAGSSRREVYLCPLREPLPAIRVPLRATDPDVPLALQPLIDRCYETGRYWLSDHSRAPEPPVAAEDEAWVVERLRAAGLR